MHLHSTHHCTPHTQHYTAHPALHSTYHCTQHTQHYTAHTTAPSTTHPHTTALSTPALHSAHHCTQHTQHYTATHHCTLHTQHYTHTPLHSAHQHYTAHTTALRTPSTTQHTPLHPALHSTHHCTQHTQHYTAHTTALSTPSTTQLHTTALSTPSTTPTHHCTQHTSTTQRTPLHSAHPALHSTHHCTQYTQHNYMEHYTPNPTHTDYVHEQHNVCTLHQRNDFFPSHSINTQHRSNHNHCHHCSACSISPVSDKHITKEDGSHVNASEVLVSIIANHYIALRRATDASLSTQLYISVTYTYVQGYCGQRNFIAAQTPMKNTEGDVWEIWMEKCAAVVVLCDGGRKQVSEDQHQEKSLPSTQPNYILLIH